MVRAFWAARRSPDPVTKIGAVIVDEFNNVVAEGFNGYPQGCDDELMPKTRPEKYLITLHAEENAILSANIPLSGCTLYVTGEPCTPCWCRIIRKRIRRVVIGPTMAVMIDEQAAQLTKLVLSFHPEIEVVRWQTDRSQLLGHIHAMIDHMGIMKND
jgi:deoxycytidylate deaminase